MPTPPETAIDGCEPEESATEAQADRIRAVLDSGFFRLRFPRSLELDFRRSTHRLRLRQNLLCAVLGTAGFWWTSWSDQELLPELTGSLTQVNLTVTLVMVCAVALCIVFRRPDRIWPQEQMTSIGVLAVAFSNIWGLVASQSFAGATHSYALVAVMAYATIVVRQRFWYALSVSLTILSTYLLFARPHDAGQQLVIMHNAMLLGLATVLALGANYRYEHGERRSFLFARLGALRLEALARTNARLEARSRTDALTDIGNRRRFDADMAHSWKQARTAGRPLALLLVDIDHFKRYNDSYGHLAGDECLKRVAALLAATAVDHDTSVYRLGGEEFALLLTDGTPVRALALAEALRKRIDEAALPHPSSPVADHLTVSVGTAAHELRRNRHDSAPALQKRADVALYRAKAGGRNLTAFGSESGPGGRSYKPRRHYSMARQDADTRREHDPANTRLTHALADQARGQWRCLRFAPYLERLYQRKRDRKRPHELVRYLLAGLVVNNLYYFFARRLLYDVPDIAASWHAVMSVVLMALVLLGALPLSARWRESLHVSGLCALSVGAIAWCTFSHAPTAPSLASSGILIAFFAVVAGNLAFRPSVVLVLVTFAAYILLIRAGTQGSAPIIHDYVNLLGFVSLFILIASYQLEYGVRRGFVERLTARTRRERLESAAQQLLALATSDPLTGIGNRRRFDTELERRWNAACAAGDHLGLLVIDIDDFKQYNDIYGHGAGDTCLYNVASTIACVAARSGGQAFRIGGEEFTLLQIGADAAGMSANAERIRAAVANLRIPHAASRATDTVSVSVGAASLAAGTGSAATTLLAAADRAMYAAKTGGRNRSECDGDASNAA